MLIMESGVTPMAEPNNEVISVKNWLLTMVILAIPLVNVVMLFVWSFSGNVNINKKNYARATLILLAVALVVSIVLMAVGNNGF
jgi:hypothetical protein